jgi:hypothetical protein
METFFWLSFMLVNLYIGSATFIRYLDHGDFKFWKMWL